MATLSLEVTDWNRSNIAELPDVPSDMMVRDLIEEVEQAMSLPRDTYHLIAGGEKLNRAATLEEIGIASGDELTIAPEVSAGAA